MMPITVLLVVLGLAGTATGIGGLWYGITATEKANAALQQTALLTQQCAVLDAQNTMTRYMVYFVGMALIGYGVKQYFNYRKAKLAAVPKKKDKPGSRLPSGADGGGSATQATEQDDGTVPIS